MAGRETKKHARTKHYKFARPHRWPKRLPLLSESAAAVIGEPMTAFVCAIQAQALMNRKGFAAFARGELKWRNHVLVWQMRAYSPESLYPNFNCDPIEVVLVVTKAEDDYNRGLTP